MTQIMNGKLHIKKRPVLQWLTWFIFVMPFLISFMTEFLGLPNFVKYTVDVVWLACILILFIKRHILIDKKLIPFLIFIAVFLLYVLIGYLFNFQSVFYLLWGLRNNFRFYYAFLVFSMVFTNEDVEIAFKFMDVLFWINIIVSLFQYFVLNLEQDFLGGIFGSSRGCNAYSIVFFSIVLSRSILKFMNREEKALRCFSKCTAVLLISAIAELKFFFVLFVVILLLATIMTSFSWRKFLIILLSAGLVFSASSILTQLFGESSNISLERIWELVTTSNYASQDDISRFTAVPMLNRIIMTNPFESLFGLGLGNCDTSTFAICNTPFYETYSYLHYTWFSSAFLFLEIGIVGLIIYLFFFVMCFVFSYKQKKKENTNKLYCQMAMILSVICVALTFYNASLRFEVAYMVYFVLALPLIDSRSNINLLNP